VSDDPRDTLEESAGGHSLFAPSASAGWMTCPDYLLANHGKGDTAGEYAAEGTVFHTVMERWNRFGRCMHEAGEKLVVTAGGDAYTIEITDEMLAYAEECFTRSADISGDRYFEVRVTFSDLMPIPNQGGTCDLAICENGLLTIRDYKFGRGVRVEAENNSQLLLYAYGAFQEWNWIYGFERINLGILQPRLEHFPVWEISRAELLAFAEVVRERAAAAWQALQEGGTKRVPSPKACLWCSAKAVCPARATMLDRMVDESFEDLEAGGAVTVAAMEETQESLDAGLYEPRLVPAREMTTRQLARLLTYRQDVEKWFKALEAELLARALDGEETEGWKLVEGRTHRRWRDNEAAERLLVSLGLRPNEFYSIEPISIPEALEKLRALGIKQSKAEKLIAPVLVKPPGRQTLARVSDNRRELSPPTDAFDDLESDL
jgi:hypothetical protein